MVYHYYRRDLPYGEVCVNDPIKNEILRSTRQHGIFWLSEIVIINCDRILREKGEQENWDRTGDEGDGDKSKQNVKTKRNIDRKVIIIGL